MSSSRRVSPDGRRELTSVNRRELADIRQYVVHTYVLVDPAELHQAVAESLRDLVDALEPVLSR